MTQTQDQTETPVGPYKDLPRDGELVAREALIISKCGVATIYWSPPWSYVVRDEHGYLLPRPPAFQLTCQGCGKRFRANSYETELDPPDTHYTLCVVEYMSRAKWWNPFSWGDYAPRVVPVRW